MTKSPLIFTLAGTSDGEFITVYAPGRDPLPADNSHVNFDAIKTACIAAAKGESVDPDEVVDLFDIGATVEREFQRLTERVAVQHGQITLDGDPVDGSLQEQILDFLDAGEDFGPLVNFYEKLATNPLGDVQAGLFDWIRAQRESGPLTITPDGDVIGYKAVLVQKPEWRETDGDVYVPSRRGEGTVNGIDVKRDQFIEQIDGDVVEMPRSKVLHAPSQMCGDGLHIGNYGYASTFLGSRPNTRVLLVKFSPRDIVSLPDSNSSWKLRVCRYTIVGTTDAALDTPLYLTAADVANAEDEAAEQGLDLNLSLDGNLAVGDRVVDYDDDEGTIEEDEDGDLVLVYDDTTFGSVPVEDGMVREGSFITTVTRNGQRIHGKGGPTSLAARGNGRNPAQDEKGRFSNGRPGSTRNASTGRFA